jgi:hypothetical protein
VCLIAVCVAVDWEVSVWVNILRKCESLLFEESGRVGHWKVYYVCGFEVCITVEQDVGTEILIAVHSGHQQNRTIVDLGCDFRISVLVVKILAFLSVALLFYLV